MTVSFVYLYSFFMAFIMTVISIPMCMKLAKRTNFLAHPRQDRLHKSPVPMLGGLGIVGSFYLMLGIHYFVVKFMPDIFTGFPE